jgi:hypothetical protein
VPAIEGGIGERGVYHERLEMVVAADLEADLMPSGEDVTTVN